VRKDENVCSLKEPVMKRLCLLNLCIIFCSHALEFQLTTLSLDQKIGQLFMVAAVADEEIAYNFMMRKSYRMDKEYIQQLIEQYHIGGIIYLGPSSPEKQIERTADYQAMSIIPLLVGQDLEPGRVGKARLPDFFDFPSNQQLGLQEDSATYQAGYEIGLVCKSLSVHINFAPVVDVNNNPCNPVINDRSFGDSSELVAHKAVVFMHGLRDAGIIACAKHVDSHIGLPVIAHDVNRLHAIELYPFKKMIAVDIPMIMIGHLEVPAFEHTKNIPATLSKNIVTNLLRNELGFTGLIVTDGLDMRGITDHYCAQEIAVRALCAGNDILLCSTDVPAAFAAIKNAIEAGIISVEELDEHVARILRMKESVFGVNN
jgi:beta-glucosidase-like glycosyl hydrolase